MIPANNGDVGTSDIGNEERNGILPFFALAVGGSDPSGGAGIQADLPAMTACGVRCLTAISAITIQNSQGITRVVPIDPEDITGQIRACLDDFPVKWIKTGILPSTALVRVVASIIDEYPVHFIVDPIFRSGKGYKFADDDILRAYAQELCPRATLVTPNQGELNALVAQVIENGDTRIQDPTLQVEALSDAWGVPVLAKGGHATGPDVVDLLRIEGQTWQFTHPRLAFAEIHGSGCFLASSITAFCARGASIPAAVADAEAMFVKTAVNAFTWRGTTFLAPLQAPIEIERDAYLCKEVESVVAVLDHHPAGVKIIPEVRTNVSILHPGGTSETDVAAVDGRITIVGDLPYPAGPIRLGVSNHTARLLIACRAVDPRVRAVMNLRYSPENVAACQAAELQCVEIRRENESPRLKQGEHGTMEWLPTQVANPPSPLPPVIYDKGDLGKEPMIRLLGDSGADLANKLARILDHLQ